jgi:hypothetical protein
MSEADDSRARSSSRLVQVSNTSTCEEVQFLKDMIFARRSISAERQMLAYGYTDVPICLIIVRSKVSSALCGKRRHKAADEHTDFKTSS